MKLIDKNELKVVLLSAIVSIIVCLGFKIGTNELNHTISVANMTQPKVTIEPAKSSASSMPVVGQNPTIAPVNSTTNVNRSLTDWQNIANSIAPGFKVGKVESIKGTNVVNLLDERKDVTNLSSAILTVASDMSWWQDARGFHLTVKGGTPIDDPRASLKKQITQTVLNDFPKDGIISFPSTAPEGIKPVDVYIFSSLDCVYCRHVEADMAKYQASGVNMHVIPFPRTGPGSPAWRLAEKIWCSPKEQRPDLLNKGFASETGDDVTAVDDKDLPAPDAECATWVKKGFEDAIWLAIPGTPGIYSANGKMVGGYIPPENLKQVIESALAE